MSQPSLNGVNRIDQTFLRLKAERKKALIGYVTAGFPTKADFMRLVPALENAGLDVLEIGVPFSDPIADGPTIQQASQSALQHGINLDWVLQAVTQLRRRVRMPILLMSYCNPILAMGLERFSRRAAAAGVD